MTDRRVPFGRTFPKGKPEEASRWKQMPDTNTIEVLDGYELESVDIIITDDGELDCSCAAADCPHLVEMTADDESSVGLLAAFIGSGPVSNIKLATRVDNERQMVVLRFVEWGHTEGNVAEEETMFDVYWIGLPEHSPLYEAFQPPLGSVERGVDNMQQVNEIVRVATESYVGVLKCLNKSHFRTKRSDLAVDAEDVASLAIFGRCKDCHKRHVEFDTLVPDEDGGRGFPKA